MSDLEWSQIRADASAARIRLSEYVRTKLMEDGSAERTRGQELADLREIADLRRDVQMVAEDVSRMGGSLTVAVLHRLSVIEGKVDRLIRRAGE